MTKTIYLCVFFLTILPSSLGQDPNDFVDSILATGVKKLHENGPIPIPGNHSLGPFGLVNIRDVVLVSIENISRLGDASIRGDEDSGIIYVNTTFTLNNIHANSSFVVNIPVKGEMRVTASTTIQQIDLTIRCEYNAAKGTLKPTSVHIDSFSGLVTEVKGLGPFNPIVEKMATITADVLEKIIANFLNLTIERQITGLEIDVPQQF